jgi:hypothetical protein
VATHKIGSERFRSSTPKSVLDQLSPGDRVEFAAGEHVVGDLWLNNVAFIGSNPGLASRFTRYCTLRTTRPGS